jgi:hypothetical protein
MIKRRVVEKRPLPSSPHAPLWRWGLVALILLAFWLQLHNAEFFSFWTDEGLTLPPDLPPGLYTIRVGLFEPETFAQPTVSQNGQPQPESQISLAEIRLP